MLGITIIILQMKNLSLREVSDLAKITLLPTG